MRILGLSSFVPEQICDFVRFKGYQGSKSISHYCGYAADYISQVLEDNSFDGAVGRLSSQVQQKTSLGERRLRQRRGRLLIRSITKSR